MATTTTTAPKKTLPVSIDSATQSEIMRRTEIARSDQLAAAAVLASQGPPMPDRTTRVTSPSHPVGMGFFDHLKRYVSGSSFADPDESTVTVNPEVMAEMTGLAPDYPNLKIEFASAAPGSRAPIVRIKPKTLVFKGKPGNTSDRQRAKGVLATLGTNKLFMDALMAGDATDDPAINTQKYKVITYKKKVPKGEQPPEPLHYYDPNDVLAKSDAAASAANPETRGLHGVGMPVPGRLRGETAPTMQAVAATTPASKWAIEASPDDRLYLFLGWRPSVELRRVPIAIVCIPLAEWTANGLPRVQRTAHGIVLYVHPECTTLQPVHREYLKTHGRKLALDHDAELTSIFMIMKNGVPPGWPDAVDDDEPTTTARPVTIEEVDDDEDEEEVPSLIPADTESALVPVAAGRPPPLKTVAAGAGARAATRGAEGTAAPTRTPSKAPTKPTRFANPGELVRKIELAIEMLDTPTVPVAAVDRALHLLRDTAVTTTGRGILPTLSTVITRLESSIAPGRTAVNTKTVRKCVDELKSIADEAPAMLDGTGMNSGVVAAVGARHPSRATAAAATAARRQRPPPAHWGEWRPVS